MTVFISSFKQSYFYFRTSNSYQGFPFITMAGNLLYWSRSRASHYSQFSSWSSIAASATAVQANAQVTKACLVFIDRKLKIKMELEKLQLVKKTTTTIAEEETLKAVTDELTEWLSYTHLRFNPTPADPSSLIRKYLAEQASQPQVQINGLQPLCNQQIHRDIKIDNLVMKTDPLPLDQGILEDSPIYPFPHYQLSLIYSKC